MIFKRGNFLVVLFFLFLSFGVISNAKASTIYINNSTGNDTTGDGTSGTPYKTFHKGYTESSASDVLDLTGTFDWTEADETGDDSTSGYTIGKNLTINGQGAEQTIVQAASADNTANRRVFTVSDGVTAVFQNLAIRYGKITGSGNDGGGIRNDGITTVSNCEIYSNRVTYDGGAGISNRNLLTVNNSTIYSNTAYYMGGGVLNHYYVDENGYLTITNSTIFGNSVTSTSAYTEGGGVHFRQGSGAITNSTIYGNSAYTTGGVGMDDNTGTLTLKNTIIAGNTGHYNIDFGFRQSGYGNVVDNGYNIIGKTSQYTFTGTGGWNDTDKDGTFTLYSVGTTGTLNMDTALSINDNQSNGVQTLALESSSIAVNNGASGTNGTISVPTTDQRGAGRNSTTDIGAFEYGGDYVVSQPTTQALEATFSSVLYNKATVSWTNGNGSRRIVFMKASNTGTAIPVDTTTYTASSVFGSGTQIGATGWFAIYEGLGTSVTVTSLSASTNYIVQVFEYNGITNGVENYFTDTATNNPKTTTTYTPVTLYCNYSTGNDATGNGSSGTPYKSFHKCYTESNSGDTLDLTGTFDWTNADETGDATTSGYTISKDLTFSGNGVESTIFQSASADNTADRRVFLISSDVITTFQDLTIRYGKVTGSSNDGGGIRNDGTTVVTGCEIYSNRATSDGGAGVSNRNLLTINNTAIYDNTAYYMGGGVLNHYNIVEGGYLTITNSTIFGNAVTATVAYTEGGGVHFRQGSGAITNSTIYGNSAHTTGGVGMDDNTGTLTLKNTIIAGNTGHYNIDFGFRQSGYGNVVDNGYNIIGKTSQYTFTSTGGWNDTDKDGTFTLYSVGTTGTLDIDTILGVNDNAARTKTLALQASSIAINNGASGTNGVVSVPVNDQRGATRNSTIDIGSFEYNGGGLSISVPTTQASEVLFSPVSYTTATISWTNGNGSKRVAFMKAVNTGTATPVDTTDYTASATFGSGTQIGSTGWYAIYNAGGNSVDVTGLSIGTDYIVQVFEYNGVMSGQADYKTDTATNNPKTQTTTDVTQPTTQTSEISFSGVSYDQMTIGWTNGNGTKRVVFVKQANTGTAVPVDDAVYTANTVFGSGTQIGSTGWYTVYNGTSTSVTITGLTASTDYIVQAFEYNEYSSTLNYFTDSATNNPKVQASIAVTEPTTQAHTITFSGVSNDQATIGWTNGNGVKRTVFIKQSNTGIATPVDATTYTANTTFGSGTQIGSTGWYAIYDGTGTSATVTGLSTSTIYIVQVFDYNGASGAENYKIDTASNNPNVRTTGLEPSAETFETNNFDTYSWTFGGNQDWEITSADKYAGTYSAKAGTISNSQETYMQVTMDVASDGNISFYKKVSSESGYDKLYFYIDGVLKTSSWSGTVAWSQSTYAVTAGSRTFKWRYAKDGSASSGSDTAWVDNIVFPSTASNQYTITYASDSNGSVTGTTSQVIASGEDGSAVTAVPGTGYQFLNWSDSSVQNPRTDTSVTEDLTVTANFATQVYSLTYTSGVNGYLTGSSPQNVSHGSDGTAITAVPNAGYRFASWSDSSTTNPRTDTNVTANISVTATFESAVPVIYVNSSTGNDTTGNGTSGTPYKTFYKAYTEADADSALDLTGTFTWSDESELGDKIIVGYSIAKNITIQGQGANQTIIQSSINDNAANRRVFTIASGVTVSITDLTIRHGRVAGYTNDGGGIRNEGITQITNCEIYGNRSMGDSGGGISNRHTLTVNNSAVYNNVAYYMGGGIVNSYYVDDSGYLTITNSTIAYNQQTVAIAYSEGGGIHFRKGSGTITNSTISYNTATGVGGVGMDDPNGTLTIKNTIIANNIRRNSSYHIDFGFRQTGNGNVVDNGYNIIGSSRNYTWTGTGNWTDVNRDGTFSLYGSTTTGTLEMESSLSLNSAFNNTKTLALASDSIAIDIGNTSINGSVSIPESDQRGLLRQGVPDIGAFEYESSPDDTTAPVISGIGSTPSSTSAVIVWTTNEISDSQIKYDANQIHSTLTDVYNTSSKVTSHEISLSELVACSKYYYVVASSDVSGNTSVSTEQSFFTTGCAGNAEVSTITESSAVPEYGGSLNQTNGGLTIEVTIPTGFAENPTDFQLKSLGSQTALASLSLPSNFNSVGSSVFDVKALHDPRTSISEFDSDVGVSITYEEDDISGLDESTLKIHRNHDDEWYELKDCNVDTDNNIITCATTNFSVFGLFGEIIAYNFTYLSGSNGSITGSTEQEVDVSSNGTEVTAVPSTGYSFSGWSDGSTANPRTDLNASEDISVTANFVVSSVTTPIQEQSTGGYWGGYNYEIIENNVDIKKVNNSFIKDNTASINSDVEITNINNSYLNKSKNNSDDVICLFKFERDLRLGIKGTDVKELQKYLNNNGYQVADKSYGSKGNETEYFGNLTKQALIKFQKDKKIITTYGIFDIKTREYLGCIKGEIAKEKIIKEFKVTEKGFVFTRDLELGMKGEDVKELQKYLNDNGYKIADIGYGSIGNETEYFGTLTKQALIKFQKDNNIKPAIGYFGKITRVFCNK